MRLSAFPGILAAEVGGANAGEISKAREPHGLVKISKPLGKG